MQLREALGLQKGDQVVHRATAIKEEPMRVTEVWVNERRTIVLVRLASVAGSVWLDALGYEMPPVGKRWCRSCLVWHTRREREAAHPEMDGRASLGLLDRRVRD